VRRLPTGPLIWKLGVAIIGGAIVILGLGLIPLPGPGWAIVFLGLAVWATEFLWAQRLLGRARELLHEWTSWVKRRSWIFQGFLGLFGLAFLAGGAYLGWMFLP
jgi:uncharacterized protein (TIGR02611 family)